MKIAIIGAGNVGGSLGRAWSAKGHDVVFASRDTNEPKTQAALAATSGRARAAKVDDAVRDAEVVVLAVPFEAVESALKSAGPMTGKILIDCTNPVGVALPAGVASGAEHVSKLAPGARVAKAFNSQGAENIARPRYGDTAATNFYCCDDDAARGVVRQLVADVGFDPVDVGPLKNARLLEAATLLWFAASRTLGTRRVAFRVLREP
jgi:8-hydroxy-5-deazaflavin:NADPH oxidoreductase